MPPGFPAREWLAVSSQGIREARASMARVEERLKGVEHETVVRAGHVCRELGAILQDDSIDLMVVGTHGRSGFGKAAFGSVAEKLFRHARCPVLTIGPHVRTEAPEVDQLHAILFPTDFSQETRAALGYALSLAREHGARLYLLHVAKQGSRWDREFLERQLRALIPEEVDLACEPKVLVEAGSPAQVILDVAEELAVDLIVLGPKHYSGMPGTMATAYRVATQAQCPVLTVRG
jgi:nucleotide-binding universal stress UspA family protein